MSLATELETIPGARGLYDWFGYWPNFHDAEIISLHLNRRGVSSMTVHTWEMSNETDSHGYYVLRKHIVVIFLIEGLSDLNLEGFSSQNVIFSLALNKRDDAWELSLGPCYGLAGTILAKRVEIKMTPGKPA